MKLLWSREALGRLIEIEEFIARDNPERAASFVDGIIAHTENILPSNPNAGRTVPELSLPNIREILYRNYRIVYRLAGDRIEVLTVFEAHRLLREDELGE